MKIENIKEEVTHDRENLRKNKQTETQAQWMATTSD
jgi:hypothetical protein